MQTKKRVNVDVDFQPFFVLTLFNLRVIYFYIIVFNIHSSLLNLFVKYTLCYRWIHT